VKNGAGLSSFFGIASAAEGLAPRRFDREHKGRGGGKIPVLANYFAARKMPLEAEFANQRNVWPAELCLLFR
jgi:hypothetical protein